MDFKEKLKDSYSGKSFSVIGDSISTYEGFNVEGNKVFYTAEKCELAGIKSHKDTWWGMLSDYLSLELVVNDSVSGSRVAKLPDRDSLAPSGCCDERTSGLHKGDVRPDIIIVYLGTNDWYNGVSLVHKHGIQRLLDQSFTYAYSNMIRKIKRNYPESEIWCCTLCPSDAKSSDGEFPFRKAGVHMKEYCDIIKSIASENACRVLDLFSHNAFYSTIDGYHPDKEGMALIKDIMLEELAQ